MSLSPLYANFVNIFVCLCVLCEHVCAWHVDGAPATSKDAARCESRGTGDTGIHSGRYPHGSLAILTHNNYTCINIMAGAH